MPSAFSHQPQTSCVCITMTIVCSIHSIGDWPSIEPISDWCHGMCMAHGSLGRVCGQTGRQIATKYCFDAKKQLTSNSRSRASPDEARLLAFLNYQDSNSPRPWRFVFWISFTMIVGENAFSLLCLLAQAQAGHNQQKITIWFIGIELYMISRHVR